MGKLIDQFCAACDTSFYVSLPRQSLSLFIVAMLGGAPVGDPDGRLSLSRATRSQIRTSLHRLVQGSRMLESFVVGGLIRAIDDVLDDCSQEAQEDAPDWSLATQRLLQQGVLSDSGKELMLAGESGTRVLNWTQQIQADLALWQKFAARILTDEHLEQAIYEE